MNFFLHTLISISLWLPTVLGYNLVFGKGKIFHFGPLGAGAFSTYVLFLVLLNTQSYALGIFAGMFATLFVALFFTWLSLRLEPDAFGVLSIAVYLAILAVILNWTAVTRGALGFPNIPRLPGLASIEAYTVLCCSVALLALGFHLWLDRTTFARQLAALAEHEWYASSLGIHRRNVYAVAFIILGLSQLVSGLLFAPYLHLLHPSDYQFSVFIFLIMVVVAGRPGSVWGASLATILLVCLREALRFVPLAPSVLGPLRLILFGAILLFAVWWRRDVVFPKARRV